MDLITCFICLYFLGKDNKPVHCSLVREKVCGNDNSLFVAATEHECRLEMHVGIEKYVFIYGQ